MSARPEVDPEVYAEARSAIRGQLEASVNEIDAHELVCEELYQRFDHYSWVGIYVVEGDELVLPRRGEGCDRGAHVVATSSSSSPAIESASSVRRARTTPGRSPPSATIRR